MAVIAASYPGFVWMTKVAVGSGETIVSIAARLGLAT
jgi:hypothetical protein